MLNIYVGNLPYTTGEEELKNLFAQFGTIAKANIISDRETGRSRGFGFVEMPNDQEGKQAIEALNGKEFGGRFLTVNEARPRTPGHPGTPAPGSSAPGNAPGNAPGHFTRAGREHGGYKPNRGSTGYGNRNSGGSAQDDESR